MFRLRLRMPGSMPCFSRCSRSSGKAGLFSRSSQIFRPSSTWRTWMLRLVAVTEPARKSMRSFSCSAVIDEVPPERAMEPVSRLDAEFAGRLQEGAPAAGAAAPAAWGQSRSRPRPRRRGRGPSRRRRPRSPATTATLEPRDLVVLAIGRRRGRSTRPRGTARLGRLEVEGRVLELIGRGPFAAGACAIRASIRQRRPAPRSAGSPEVASAWS